MPAILETNDIFRCAYLLTMGGDLTDIKIRRNGKPVGIFIIKGSRLNDLDRQYRTGKALVNPLQLRESLNHLRDLLFTKLKQHEERSRYDRKRAHRGNQARYRS